MAKINCKCGEPLTIEPDATHISCPACKAIFRVRAASAPAPAPVAPPPPVAKASPIPRVPAPIAAKARPVVAAVKQAPVAKTAVARPVAATGAKLVARPLPSNMPKRPPTPAPKVAPPPPVLEEEIPVEETEIDAAVESQDAVENVEAVESSTAESGWVHPSDEADAISGEQEAPAHVDAASASKAAVGKATTAARKAVARSATRSAVKAGRPSKTPLIMGIIGIVMGLVGGALLIVNAMDKTPVKTSATEKARVEELKKKFDVLGNELAEERKNQRVVQAALDAATKKSKEIAYNNEMFDPRFNAAANGIVVVGPLKELEKVKEERLDIREKLKLAQNRGNITQLIAQAEKTVVIIRTNHGSGSGFLLTASGLCATNYHVVEGARELKIKIQKKDSRDQVELVGAKIIAANRERDLALIQLPPAPASVSQDDGYPKIVFRDSEPLAGESVIAIGSPGLEAKLLEYSVTQGIVSNARRMYGTIDMIQTDAGVNPGNSGGPLFDGAGYLLGVVSAKGIGVENVAFAIPAKALQELIEKKGEEDYKVDTLSEWERKNNPKLSLTYADDAAQKKFGFVLPDECSIMTVGDDGKTVYLVLGHNGKIQEYLIAENKMGKSYECGSHVDAMWVRKASGTMAVLMSAAKKVLILNTQTMTVDKTVALRSIPAIGSFLGGSGDYIVLSNPVRGENSESTLIVPNETAGGTPAQIELPRNLFPISSASNSKWAVFETFDLASDNVKLLAYPIDVCTAQIREWSEARQKNATMSSAEIKTKLEAFSKKLLEVERKYEVPGNRNDAERGPISFLDADTIIMGRHAYKIGEKIEEAREFEENPELKNGNMLDAQHWMLKDGDTIRTGDASGKFATSRTHIYDATAGKILKKIPFLCTQPHFSRDGKTLFALDGTQHFLFRFKDWESSLEAPK